MQGKALEMQVIKDHVPLNIPAKSTESRGLTAGSSKAEVCTSDTP